MLEEEDYSLNQEGMLFRILSPEEDVKRKIKQFPEALSGLTYAITLAGSHAGSYKFIEAKEIGKSVLCIVDEEAIEAMIMGIRNIHNELVQNGKKDFADRAIQESKR